MHETPPNHGPADNPHSSDRRNHAPARLLGISFSIVLAALAIFAFTLTTLRWSEPNRSPLALAILNLHIIDGIVPVALNGLAIIAALYLLVRRVPRSWLALEPVLAIITGAAVGVVVLWIVGLTDAFGVDLSVATSAWAIGLFIALALAVWSIWRSPWPRKLGAVLSIIVFLLTATVGINADFGLDRTVADLAGISTSEVTTLPLLAPIATPSATASQSAFDTRKPAVALPLWQTWKAPAGMPTTGTTSVVTIPNTLSGFKSRQAGLYLPPAALGANPPALPMVIMMMGQPGNPDPSFTAAVLNDYASRHNGLAPIVLVVDQLGNPAIDPLCIDTPKMGKAETFVVRDAVNWARSHLRVQQDPAHWVVAGYSNGGQCALSFGVKYPSIFGNVLDISGEEYPGSEFSAQVLAAAFGGNVAAYEAVKPLPIMARTTYPNTLGIFTVGSNDTAYRLVALKVSAAARVANWATTYYEVPNGGHVLGALNGGLTKGYSVLYPRLELSAPGVAP